jgi:hypothetical protein
MSTIRDLDAAAFEGLTTPELQMLIWASPFQLLEDQPFYIVPTKDFQRWVMLASLLAQQHDVDRSSFLADFSTNLSAITRRFGRGSVRRGTAARRYDPYQLSNTYFDAVVRRYDLDDFSTVDRLVQATESSLEEKGLLVDPIETVLGPATIIVLGVIPYQVQFRTREGDAIVNRFRALFWDFTMRQQRNRPTEIVANIRILAFIRALGHTVTSEFKKLFDEDRPHR